MTADALLPRVIEVDDGEAVIGRIIAHIDVQFDGFDLNGRPVGTFRRFPAAVSAVRGAYNGGAA